MFGGARMHGTLLEELVGPRTLSRGLMDAAESGPFPRTGIYPFEKSVQIQILLKEKIITP